MADNIFTNRLGFRMFRFGLLLYNYSYSCRNRTFQSEFSCDNTGINYDVIRDKDLKIIVG